jgi:hypothetical protein
VSWFVPTATWLELTAATAKDNKVCSMPKAHLTQQGLMSLQPPVKGQTEYWDSTLPAFGIRTSQGGSKTFILKHGNRRITIGRFPVLTLSEARGEAKRMMACQIASNCDPLFASKNDPSGGAETGGAEPHIVEQSRSWRAARGERELMRGS